MNAEQFTVSIHVRLPTLMAQRLDRLVEVNSFTRPTKTQIVRQAIKEYLERHDTQRGQTQHKEAAMNKPKTTMAALGWRRNDGE
tara:strand:+ start:2487 stop:2738 length:252 start_codon:yes stop_codon:yes gene_type:complete